MSKIICDICGTSYADTATQCPICGCVRPAEPQPVPEEENNSSAYTYVKGGRFSKSNVKKRAASEPKQPKEEKSGKKGAALLLIAIVLVGIIALGVILWATGVFDMFAPGDGAPATTPSPTEENLPKDIPCEAITVAKKQYLLAQVGDIVLLDCRKIPVESTDMMTFTSENEEVATVDANGRVTAVENGKTNIIITCGNVTDTCQIVVGDGVFPVELVLKASEIKLSKMGDTFVIYDGPISPEKITWTSDNELIASVKDGVVTAEAPGPTTITATYLDKTVSCEVLCDFEPTGNGGGVSEDGSGLSGNGGGITEDGGDNVSTADFAIYTQYGVLAGNDASLKVGEVIYLYLGNSSGKRISTDWTCADEEHFSISENIVKGLKSTGNLPITISTVYEGKTYTCVFRIP